MYGVHEKTDFPTTDYGIQWIFLEVTISIKTPNMYLTYSEFIYLQCALYNAPTLLEIPIEYQAQPKI